MVDAVIEMATGQRAKYKMVNGLPKLDSIRYFAMPTPMACGAVVNTRTELGTPLEIVIFESESLIPGALLPVRVIGYLEMYRDEELYHRVVSVSDLDPRYKEIDNLSDVSHFSLSEMQQYYKNYGKLHDRDMRIVGFHGKEEALELIRKYTVSGEENQVTPVNGVVASNVENIYYTQEDSTL